MELGATEKSIKELNKTIIKNNELTIEQNEKMIKYTCSIKNSLGELTPCLFLCLS